MPLIPYITKRFSNSNQTVISQANTIIKGVSTPRIYVDSAAVVLSICLSGFTAEYGPVLQESGQRHQ